MDLIVGLPGEEMPEVQHTMEEVSAPGPGQHYGSFPGCETGSKTEYV